MKFHFFKHKLHLHILQLNICNLKLLIKGIVIFIYQSKRIVSTGRQKSNKKRTASSK